MNTGQRKVSVELTAEELACLMRALGALDIELVREEGQQRRFGRMSDPRAFLHRLWGRLKESHEKVTR